MTNLLRALTEWFGHEWSFTVEATGPDLVKPKWGPMAIYSSRLATAM
jgi:hypothetical protein